MEDVVLNWVGILELFCPKQGQGFRPSAASGYPNMDQVPSPPPREKAQRQNCKGNCMGIRCGKFVTLTKLEECSQRRWWKDLKIVNIWNVSEVKLFPLFDCLYFKFCPTNKQRRKVKRKLIPFTDV